MVLNEKKTTVAYRCPECGAVVRSMFGAFSLGADMLRLKCPCGGSDMTLVYTKEKKIRLMVPCFICPQPHSFTVSAQMFFGRGAYRAFVPLFGTGHMLHRRGGQRHTCLRGERSGA